MALLSVSVYSRCVNILRKD